MTDQAAVRMPPQYSPEQQSPATRVRDPFMDNAKYLAVALVVCGHTWGTMAWHSKAVTAAYELVYTFHMPVFVVITGFLSRSFTGRPDQWKRLLTGVVVPYLVVQVLFSVWVNALSDSWTPIRMLTPLYHLWFLPALFVWRMTTPLWKALRPSAGLTLAVALCLVAGTYPLGATLDLPRVLQFMPYFVLGLHLRPQYFARLRASRAARPLALLVFAAAGAAIYLRGTDQNLSWLMRHFDHQSLHVSYPRWMLDNLALAAAALVLGIAFLALVPTRRTWFTALGSRSLYAYLLHPFVTYGGTLLHWWSPEFWWTPLGEIVLTVIAFSLATILSLGFVQRVLRPVLEPRLPWLFARTELAVAELRDETRR
ncbi:acyltransferase family protein [Streptomyces sp. NPDC092296]|uniref:acyltransferase family protein n=1 Tax=Streptomyces sp. NPDC092296 TaxID=3366012 RepID=UPI0038021926